MKIAIDTTYYAGMTSVIDLPVDWDQIEDWYVKWHTFHYWLKGEKGKEYEIELESPDPEIVDFKRPSNVTVFPADEEGNPDWSDALYED